MRHRRRHHRRCRVGIFLRDLVRVRVRVRVRARARIRIRVMGRVRVRVRACSLRGEN
jgi:hypothetical protein